MPFPFPELGGVIFRKLHHPRPRQLWRGQRTFFGTKANAEILAVNPKTKTRNVEASLVRDNVKVQVEKHDVVRNPSRIQMISNELYAQVFPGRDRAEGLTENIVRRSRVHLEAHGLWSPPLDPSPSIGFTLPPLEGPSIDVHFRVIAEQQAGGYKAILKDLTEARIPDMPAEWKLEEGWTKYLSNGTSSSVPFPDEDAYVFDVEVCVPNGPIPVMATAVSSKSWYSWCSPNLVHGVDTNPTDRITLNDLIPFETYSGETKPRDGQWKEKIIIGHNVSYDRARIREQYFLEETKLRFLDTMSLHIAVSGITSFQRALKLTMKSGLQPLASDKREELMIAGALEWNDISSLNNLKDVYKLYCDKVLDKDTRDIFISGNIMDIRNDFQNTMSYCARDVRATHEVIAKLLPAYYERFPHPVTFSGMLEMGMAYLPVNSNWVEYITRAETSYHNLEREMKSILVQKAEDAVKLLEDEKYKNDPWLWDLDWKVSRVRKKKVVKKSTTDESWSEPEVLVPQKSYPAWYKKLFYKVSSVWDNAKDEDFMPGPSNISTSMRVVPKLLRLCWFGFPLHYSKKGGWGYLVKSPAGLDNPGLPDSSSEDSNEVLGPDHGVEVEEAEDTSAQFPYEQWEQIWSKNKAKLIRTLKDRNSESATNVTLLGGHVRSKGEDVAQELKDFINGLDSIKAIGLRSGKGKKGNGAFPRSLAGTSPHPKCEFRPLPHKDGANFRVGNPLAKDFLNKLEEGILSCESGEDIADTVVRLSKMVSYWRNNRDRIMEQVTVWMRAEGQGEDVEPSEFGLGAILPQVSVAGTLTRRAVERTWLTASNAYVDRVGSELKGMIQAPPNYHFVGADVDSQELWIASVIGDSDFAGFHGSTALGWMTLQGTKSAGTDMHSKTAALIGIDRDQAKVLNYGRIYGAGVSFAERLLMQFNHQMSSTEARTKARTMYQMTKGTRKYVLNEEGQAVAENFPKFRDRLDEPVTREDLRYLVRSLQHPPADYMDLVKKVVWDEGTESPMFNRLEEIAQQECPVTPILGCCISRSLVPSVVHQDFMTSRVNWVVQSSAVDYLHLMLTCARWLFKKYGIQGRFSISVHDEVRYLVKSEDRYRAAMALQITNLLTRAACSYNLGMYDLPQSVAFFSCVDIDKVLRKEVTQDGVTPSNPDGLAKGYGIPQGEALTIFDVLDITKGSLERS